MAKIQHKCVPYKTMPYFLETGLRSEMSLLLILMVCFFFNITFSGQSGIEFAFLKCKFNSTMFTESYVEKETY